MGEKVYKPIVKEGDHLDHSRSNPDRLRGVSRDQNNKNPDIIEWEEYDVDDLQYDSYSNENNHVELTQEQQEMADMIGAAVAAGTIYVFENVIAPWCKDTVWPRMKEKGNQIKKAVIRKTSSKKGTVSSAQKETQLTSSEFVVSDTELSEKIDQVFDQVFFEMSSEEAQQHMMRLIYHMLGVVNEIRILSNTKIKNECESQDIYLEKQAKTEAFLSEKVAIRLNQLLEDDKLKLDLTTSRELFALTGGGVRLNGEYVQVQPEKISEVFEKMTSEEDGIK